jgi:DNA invertase Pin-like site-specific DNA recombinase
MNHQVVGYIRVSSQGQNTARQLSGVKLDKEFVDIMSGSTKNREKLIECIEYVRDGDTLVVESIDRLARNLRDLQEIIDSLIEKGVSVKFVKENLTFTAEKDPLSNLMLHMMGAFAEFERTMIKSRQKDGIAAARLAGRHLGRPSKITKAMRNDAVKMITTQNISIRKTAQSLGLSRASVYKILEQEKITKVTHFNIPSDSNKNAI